MHLFLYYITFNLMWNLILKLAENKKISWLLAIAWTLLIIYGVTKPGKDLPKLHLFDQADKVVHFLFFFIWTIFVWMSGKLSLYKLIIIMFLATLFGFAIEWYQLHYVKGRSFDMWDGIADMIGAVAAWPICKKISAQLGA
jgi:VanZ family protein